MSVPRIKEGDHVVVTGGGVKRIIQIKKGQRARLGNSGSAELDSLIGMRYGEVVHLSHTGKRFVATNQYPDLDISAVGEEIDTSRDNRDLIDNNRSQQLSSSDVASIRREGGVDALLDQLVENSATFQNKTQYSQEKYLRRKKSKYGTLFKLEAVTVDQMAEVHIPTIQPTDQDPEECRALRLRADTVALILHHSEVHASSRVLLFERTNGILPCYMLSRLGSKGTIFQIMERNAQPNTFHAKTLQLTDVKRRWKAVPHNEGFMTGVESVRPEEPKVNAEGRDMKGEETPRFTGESQWLKGAEAHRLLKEQPADSLVIADDSTAMEVLRDLFPFLAYGGHLVIYTPYLEDLSPIYTMLRRDCVNIRVSETWYRYQQVLPQRTHPTVNMSTAAGHLLTAVKVNPAGRPGLNSFPPGITSPSSLEAAVGEKRQRTAYRLLLSAAFVSLTSTMIYDVNSPAYQQFLRSSGRRRDDYGRVSKNVAINKKTSKPAGAASTGLPSLGFLLRARPRASDKKKKKKCLLFTKLMVLSYLATCQGDALHTFCISPRRLFLFLVISLLSLGFKKQVVVFLLFFFYFSMTIVSPVSDTAYRFSPLALEQIGYWPSSLASGSAFRIELESVGGKRFHTGVQPPLYSTAKICKDGYIVATAYPDKGRCVVEPVHTLDTSSSMNLPSAGSASAFPAQYFQSLRMVEVFVNLVEEGLITCVKLVVDRLLPETVKGPTRNSSRSQNSGPKPGGLGAPLDRGYVHLFIGTSYGVFLVCDALHGHILAVSRFVDWNNKPSTDAAQGTGAMTQFNSSVPPRLNADGEYEGTIVACVPSRTDQAQRWNPQLKLSQELSEQGELQLVYIIHLNGCVISLEREALDIFITTARRVNEEAMLKRGALLPRPSLRTASLEDTGSPIPSAGPAWKFVSTIKEIYDLDDVPEISEEPAENRRKVLGAGCFEYSTAGLEESMRNGKVQHYPALILCGSGPNYSIHVVAHKEASLTANAVKMVSMMTNTVVSGVRLLQGFFSHAPVAPPPVVKSLEHRKLSLKSRFMDGGLSITKVRIDPTQQWGALYAEDSGNLYIVSLASGLIARELRGRVRVQFQWLLCAAPRRQQRLFLMVLQSDRQVLEVHDLHYRYRVAAVSIAPEAILLPPVSSSDGAEYSELLCLMPTGAVSRLVLDPSALMLDPVGPSSLAFPHQETANNIKSGLNHTTVSEILETCHSPDEFFDCAMNIALPQFAASEAVSAPHSYAVGLDYFLLYIQLIEQICEWLEWQCAPGEASCRCIPFVGLEPQRIPRNLTAGQTLNFLRNHMALVRCYHALVAPPPGVPFTPETEKVSHFTQNSLGTSPSVSSLWEFLVPRRLMDAPSLPSPADSSPHSSGKGIPKFWKRVFHHIRDSLVRYAVDEGRSRQDGDVLEGSFWAALMGAPQESSAAPLPPMSIMDLKVFQRYFYCGEEQLMFLAHRIQREETDNAQRDTFAKLGDVVFGQYGLAIFPYQLHPLTELGLSMRHIALVCVSWIAKSCATVGAKTFFSATPLGSFVATIAALSEDAILYALEVNPLVIISRSKEELQQTQNRLVGLILICAVRCMVAKRKEPTQESGAGRTNSQLRGSPFHLSLCRFLRLWELMKDESAYIMSLEDLPETPPKPLRTHILHQTVPFSGAASATTIEEYILEASNMNFDAVLKMHSTVERSGMEPKGSLNYMELAQLLHLCGVPGLFALSQSSAPKNSSADVSDCDAFSIWVQSGVWNRESFDTKARKPLLDLWGTLAPRLSSSDVGELVSPARQFDQCCFLVGLLGVVEELIRPLQLRLEHFWETGTIPTRDFFSVEPKSAKDSASVSYLSGSRSMDDYFASLADMLLFIVEVQRGVGLDSEDAQLSVSKTLSLYIANDDQRVFTTVPSGLRDRLYILLSMVGEAPGFIRQCTGKLIGIVNIIQFFMHSAQLQLHFLQTPARGALTVSTIELVNHQKDKQNLIARTLRNFLRVGVLQEEHGPQQAAGSKGKGHPKRGPYDLYTDEMMDRIQSVDTYRILAQLGSLMGLNENVASLIVLDFHLKHFLDTVYVEQQLNQERSNTACVRLVTSHLKLFLHYMLHHLDSKVSTAAAKRGVKMEGATRGELQRKISPKFVNWLKLSTEASGTVEAMEIAALSTDETRQMCIMMEGGVEWFTTEEKEEYVKLVRDIIEMGDRNQKDRLRSVFFYLRQFIDGSEPKTLGAVREFVKDIRVVSGYFDSFAKTNAPISRIRRQKRKAILLLSLLLLRKIKEVTPPPLVRAGSPDGVPSAGVVLPAFGFRFLSLSLSLIIFPRYFFVLGVCTHLTRKFIIETVARERRIGMERSLLELRDFVVRELSPFYNNGEPLRLELSADDTQRAAGEPHQNKKRGRDEAPSADQEDVRKRAIDAFSDAVKDLLSEEDYNAVQKGLEEDIDKISLLKVEKADRSAIHQAVKTHLSATHLSSTENGLLTIAKATAAGRREQRQRSTPLRQRAFLHFTVYKENMDSSQAFRLMAKHLHLSTRQIEFCGTKDKRAVTLQRVAIRDIEVSRVKQLNHRSFGPRGQTVKVSGFQVLEKGLRLGDATGNHFSIALRLYPGHERPSQEFLKDIEHSIAQHGVLNYFGPQRFGTTDILTSDIGIAILQGQLQDAIGQMLKSKAIFVPDVADAAASYAAGDFDAALQALPHFCMQERDMLRHLVQHPNDYTGVLQTIPRTMAMLYFHAVQSLLWNRMASQRLADPSRMGVEVGDLVLQKVYELRLEERAACASTPHILRLHEYIREEDESKLPAVRLLTAEDPLECFELSDVVLTVPGPDPNLLYPASQGCTREDYAALMRELSVETELMGTEASRLTKIFHFHGTYRPLLVRPERVELTALEAPKWTAPVIPTDLEEHYRKAGASPSPASGDVPEEAAETAEVASEQPPSVEEPKEAQAVAPAASPVAVVRLGVVVVFFIYIPTVTSINDTTIKPSSQAVHLHRHRILTVRFLFCLLFNKTVRGSLHTAALPVIIALPIISSGTRDAPHSRSAPKKKRKRHFDYLLLSGCFLFHLVFVLLIDNNMYMNALETEVESLSAEVTRLRLMLQRVTDTMAAFQPHPHPQPLTYQQYIPPAMLAPVSQQSSLYAFPSGAAADPAMLYRQMLAMEAMGASRGRHACRASGGHRHSHRSRKNSAGQHRQHRRHQRRRSHRYESRSGSYTESVTGDYSSSTSHDGSGSSSAETYDEELAWRGRRMLKKKSTEKATAESKREPKAEPSPDHTNLPRNSASTDSTKPPPSASLNTSKADHQTREKSSSASGTLNTSRSSPMPVPPRNTVPPQATALPLAPSSTTVAAAPSPAVTAPNASESRPVAAPAPAATPAKSTATPAVKTAPKVVPAPVAQTLSPRVVKAPAVHSSKESPTTAASAVEAPATTLVKKIPAGQAPAAAGKKGDDDSSDDAFPGLRPGLRPLQPAALISPTHAAGTAGVRTPQTQHASMESSSSDSSYSSGSSSGSSISAEFDKVMGNVRASKGAASGPSGSQNNRAVPRPASAQAQRTASPSVGGRGTASGRGTGLSPKPLTSSPTTVLNNSNAHFHQPPPPQQKFSPGLAAEKSPPKQMSFSVARDMYSAALAGPGLPVPNPAAASGIPRPTSAGPVRSGSGSKDPVRTKQQSPNLPQQTSPSKRFLTRAEAVHPLSPSRAKKAEPAKENTNGSPKQGNFISSDILEGVDDKSSNPNDQSRNSDDLRKNFYCGAALTYFSIIVLFLVSIDNGYWFSLLFVFDLLGAMKFIFPTLSTSACDEGMIGSSSFVSLCQELSHIQMGLLQRTDAPEVFVSRALALFKQHRQGIEVTAENAPSVPVFLRSCASIFQKVSDKEHLPALSAMTDVHRVATQYVGDRLGDVNEASSVLSAVIGLDAVQRRLFASMPATSSDTQRFASLLRPSYTHAFHEWAQHRTAVQTLSVLSLLRGTATIHASDFHFPPSNPDQRGLLPLKSRVQMEAKMQRCPGARELVSALKSMELNRLDAGMCLTMLSEIGFYDTDLCNLACEVLHSAHAVITSQQFCQIIYSLGVLQHRHIYQRFFSSLMVPKQCNAEGIRLHTLGLAMLQQPPHSETQLMNGIFLHALRAERQKKTQRHDRRGGDRPPPSPYELPCQWYVDVGYALSCLDVSHHKYKLLLARQARGPVRRMSTAERCKLLYALGCPDDPSVPAELKDSWDNKLRKTFSLTVRRLEDIEVAEGPQVMHALRFCGVDQHPRIPQAPPPGTDSSKANPVEVLLRTWVNTPKERILHLAEQIDNEQLMIQGAAAPTAKLAEVVATLVKACPSPSPRDQYRFASLCATVDLHAGELSAAESLGILSGLQKMGLTQQYDGTVRKLLDQLWASRAGMTDSQRQAAEKLMSQLGDAERASQEWLITENKQKLFLMYCHIRLWRMCDTSCFFELDKMTPITSGSWNAIGQNLFNSMTPTSTVPMEVTYTLNGQTQTARFEVRRDGQDLLVSHGTAVENWQRAPQYLGDVQAVSLPDTATIWGSFAPSKQHELSFTQFLQGFMHQHAALTEERITLFRQYDANVLALAEMQSQLQAAVANAEYCHSMAQTQLAHEVELTQLRIANERSHIERDRAQLENSQYAVAQKEEEIKLTTANLEAKAQALRQAEVEFQAAQERSARKDAEAQQQLAASAAALADGNKNQAAKAQALAEQQAQLNAWAAQLQNREESFKGYKARVEQEMQEVQRTRRSLDAKKSELDTASTALQAQQVALQARTETYARLEEELALQRRVLAKPAPPGANNPPLADAYVRGSRRRAGRTPSDSSSSYTSDGRSDSSSSSDDSIFSLPIRGRANEKHRPRRHGSRRARVRDPGQGGNKILRCEYVLFILKLRSRYLYGAAEAKEVARDKFELLRLWIESAVEQNTEHNSPFVQLGQRLLDGLRITVESINNKKFSTGEAYSALTQKYDSGDVVGSVLHATAVAIAYPATRGIAPEDAAPAPLTVAIPNEKKKTTTPGGSSDSTFLRKGYDRSLTHPTIGGSDPRAFFPTADAGSNGSGRGPRSGKRGGACPMGRFNMEVEDFCGATVHPLLQTNEHPPQLDDGSSFSFQQKSEILHQGAVRPMASGHAQFPKRSLRLPDTGFTKTSGQGTEKQAPPLKRRELNSIIRALPDFSDKVALRFAWITASRWAEVTKLRRKNFILRKHSVVVDWAALPKSSDINPNRASRYCKITGKDAIRLQRVLAPLHPEDPLTSLTDSTLLKHLRQFGCSKHSIKRGAIQEATKIVRRNRHRFNDIHIISQLAKHKSATDISSVTVGYAGEFLADVAPINALMRRIATITRRAHHSRLATEEEVLNISLQQTDVTPLDLQAIKHRMNPTTLERFESLFATLSLPPTTFSTPGEQKRRLHASDAQLLLTTGAVNDATSAFRKAATVVGATVGEFMCPVTKYDFLGVHYDHLQSAVSLAPKFLTKYERDPLCRTITEYVVLPSSVWRQARVLNQLILTNTPYVQRLGPSFYPFRIIPYKNETFNDWFVLDMSYSIAEIMYMHNKLLCMHYYYTFFISQSTLIFPFVCSVLWQSCLLSYRRSFIMGKNRKNAPKQKRKLSKSERSRKLTKKGKIKHKSGDLKMVSSRNVSFDVKQKKGGKWVRTGERKISRIDDHLLFTALALKRLRKRAISYFTAWSAESSSNIKRQFIVKKSNARRCSRACPDFYSIIELIVLFTNTTIEVDEALATSVFQYVLHAHPVSPDADAYVHRWELPHIEYFCEEMNLRLDDLSFYLVAHMLGCKGNVPLTVLEFEFVKGLAALQLHLPPEAADQVLRGANYGPFFSVLRQAMEACNQRLRSTPKGKELQSFYVFLYNFVLRYNEDSEPSRCLLATELWEMFFYSTSARGSPFLDYAPFLHLPEWVQFVNCPSFYHQVYDEALGDLRGGHHISADLWQQLFLFADLDNYTNYDFNAAWPNAMDEFVSLVSYAAEGVTFYVSTPSDKVLLSSVSYLIPGKQISVTSRSFLFGSGTLKSPQALSCCYSYQCVPPAP
eukprot:gene6727-4822_t